MNLSGVQSYLRRGFSRASFITPAGPGGPLIEIRRLGGYTELLRGVHQGDKVGASMKTKQRDVLELGVYFIVAILPSLVALGDTASPSAMHEQIYSEWGFLKELLKSLRFGCLAAFFLFLNPFDPSFCEISPKTTSRVKQILAGVGMWFGYYLFFTFWGFLSSRLDIKSPSTAWIHPVTTFETGQNAVFSLVNGISEEMERIYLLSQLLKLGLRRWGAAAVTALLIASYHLYQGWFTGVAFVIANLFFNTYYLKHRSLLTLFVWHVLSDFMHSTDLVGWEIVSMVIGGTAADPGSLLQLIH